MFLKYKKNFLVKGIYTTICFSSKAIVFLPLLEIAVAIKQMHSEGGNSKKFSKYTFKMWSSKELSVL